MDRVERVCLPRRNNRQAEVVSLGIGTYFENSYRRVLYRLFFPGELVRRGRSLLFILRRPRCFFIYMKNFAFVAWMLGYALFVLIERSTFSLRYPGEKLADYAIARLVDMLINIAIWAFVGYQLFER